MPGLNSSTAKALIGRFLLPSERKALSAFASIQEEFATPFSRKKLSEAVGKPLTTDDDVLEVALDSYLGNNSSTLERLPPEIRKIAESVGTRSKKVAELEARGVPIPRTLLSKEEGTQDILAKVGERFDQSRKNLGWENPPNSLQDLAEYPKLSTEFLWGVDPKNPIPGIRERYKDWADFVHTSLEDKEIRAIMRYARVRDYIDPDRAFPPEGSEEFKKWIKILGVSGFASQLFLPEEAEAAPKLKASQLKALAEEAWPITKELLAKGGPIEFDHSRRYWARRLGGGGMFWDRNKDPERFKAWVRPWLEKALEMGEKEALKAKAFIELGDREGRPYYYELALQILHRIHTHDTPAVRAVEELIAKFGDKPAVAKALLSHSPKEYKEMMEKTFKEWDFATIVGVLGAGVGAWAISTPDEAEASTLDKALAALAQKFGTKKVTPEFLRNFLTQKMGVTSKELETRGIDAWLSGRKEVTLGEALETLKKQKPPISEVWVEEPVYAPWTLPGTKNYRELLIRAEQVEGVNSTSKLARVETLKDKLRAQSQGFLPGTELPHRFWSRMDALETIHKKLRPFSYESPHWGYPNVLAHIRFSDREFPKHGRTLMVEEFQSDWSKDWRAQEVGRATGNARIPKHPLIENWQSLVANRALKEAVDGNYKALAWAGSETHEARYALGDREWTKALYDEAMVNRFNKIGKKYGVQVTSDVIERVRPIASEEDIRVLEQYRDEFQKALKAFEREIYPTNTLFHLLEETADYLVNKGLLSELEVQTLEGPGFELVQNLLEGNSPIKDYFKGQVDKFKVFILPITSEMRKAISKEPFDAFIKYALGGVTLGGLLTGEDAEAGFLPKKLTQAAAKKLGNLSSASIKLKGAELMGKTIKDVRLGNEPWRYITFEDGTYLPIHKKYIASLVSSEGEKTYTSMYDLLPKGQQKLMLERSHALRMADILSPKELAKGLDARASHLKELGEEAPERTLAQFRGKQTLLPTLYAEGVKKYGEPRLDSLPQIFRKIETVEKSTPSVLPPSRGVKKTSPVSKPQLSMKDKAIRNLERALKAKGRLPPGDEYILRRLKGASPEEAEKGLKLVSKTSVERMVKRILEESR